MTRILFCGLILVCIALGPLMAQPAEGAAAPDFSLTGSDGQTYTLSQFKGKKPVVIAWFPKAFTGG